MKSRTSLLVLAASLVATPALADDGEAGLTSHAKVQQQARSSAVVGQLARMPHTQDMLAWSQRVWSDMTLPSPSTTRQSVHPGYIEYYRYIEDITRSETTICGNGAGALEFVIMATFQMRDQATHYNASTGRVVPGNFYNHDRRNSVDVRISVPIILSIQGDRVTHSLSPNYSLNTRMQNPMLAPFHDGIRQSIQRIPTYSVPLASAEQRRVAQSDPAGFQRGWANIESC